MADDNKPLTMTVPEAGKKYFGLSLTALTGRPNAAKFQPFGSGACFGCQCAP